MKLMFFAMLSLYPALPTCKTASNFWAIYGKEIIPDPAYPLLRHSEPVQFYLRKRTNRQRRDRQLLRKLYLPKQISQERALQVVELMGRLRDIPNVIRLHKCILDANEFSIFMERLEGDLEANLEAFQALPWTQKLRMVAEVTRALETIHDLGFVHGDIKPQNIVIDSSGRVLKVIDFDLSVRNGNKRINSTPFYAAPETITHRQDAALVAQDSWNWVLGLCELFVTDFDYEPPVDAWQDVEGLFVEKVLPSVRRQLQALSQESELPFDAVMGGWLALDPLKRPNMHVIEGGLDELRSKAASLENKGAKAKQSLTKRLGQVFKTTSARPPTTRLRQPRGDPRKQLSPARPETADEMKKQRLSLLKRTTTYSLDVGVRGKK